MNDLLTIVLTLKDRHDFTLRWLKWANLQRCPFKILIADGSKEDLVKSYLIEENIKYLNIEYFKYNYDATLKEWFFKINDILSHVKTKYTIQTDNDDFFLFNRLLESVSKLDYSDEDRFYTRPQYRVGFDIKGDNENINMMLYPKKKILVQKTEFNPEKFSHPDVLIRLEHAMHNFMPAPFWYGIHTTSALKEIHNFIYNSGIQIAFFQELFLYCYTVIKNRIRYHDTFPYLVRQEFTSQSARSLYKTEALDRIFLLHSWSDDLHKFISKLHVEIQLSDVSLSLEEFEGIFKKYFHALLLRWNRFSYFSNQAKSSHVIQKAKSLYQRYSYARAHCEIQKYRDDKELMKLKDFLFL